VESKSDVRAEAAQLELVSAAKPDSQELCFVDGDLAAELSRRLAGRFRPGPIIDREGHLLGEHRGLPFYTVGQRSRLDIRPGRPDATPLYVLELDPAFNRVVVGPAEALRRSGLRAGDCRWVSGAPPDAGSAVLVQLRAHGRPHAARVVAASSRTVEVNFVEPAAQVSPGQAAVLYRVDEVVGGGVVEEAGR
jgi:tRNA-specific 2-thiouridylase